MDLEKYILQYIDTRVRRLIPHRKIRFGEQEAGVELVWSCGREDVVKLH